MRFNHKSILPLFASVVLVASSLMTTLVNAEEYVISGNGENSTSEISVAVSSTSTVEQTNNADVTNAVDASATTGANEASGNSGEASITTGDISEDISVENTLNSSSVETPCCPSDTTLEISGNGTDSQNTIDLTNTETNTVVVNQVANITNSIAGSANTGDNQANNNGGNVSIFTGNIFAESMVKNGPVNFYDITSGVGGGSLFASINGNGEGSTSDILASFGFGNEIYANNIFNANNEIFWDLNTGRNTANGNFGDVTIRTGDIFLNVLIENIANLGKVVVDCCGEEPPSEPPCDPCEPGDGVTPPPSGGGGGGGGGGDGGGAGAGGPGILGLSDTSSPAAQALLFLIGLIMIAGGSAITFKELNVKKKIAPARARR